MARESGVLMSVSSLWGDYGIGSFGQEARQFVDALAQGGFSCWQVLPLCPVDEYNSPYKSFSSFGGNWFYVDLPTLAREGLLTPQELNGERQQGEYLCEYPRLHARRFEVLRKAAERVANRRPIEEFCLARPQVDAFCRFMALRHANADRPWQEWSCQDLDPRELFAWRFSQYCFFTQWQALKEYANARGVALMGDLPIYVSPDSADVWQDPDLFLLDERGYPAQEAGVSPDYFCAEGQRWGNPLYRWDRMRRDGFAWWRRRIAHAGTLFDRVRLDHFRALESYWAIPADAKSAREGKWKKGPGMPMVKALQEAAGKDVQIVAEDLGDITPAVRRLVEKSGFCGMRVFQFGFLPGDNAWHRPHNYPAHCVAYSGTHDNNTLLGFLWECAPQERQDMLAYCGHTGPWEQGLDSMIRTLFASHADQIVLPIQDLLGFGSDTRLNTPGRAENNWAYRLSQSQFQALDWPHWRRLNQLYGRA